MPPDRPRPVAPPPGEGWPDLPGWSVPKRSERAAPAARPEPDGEAPTPVPAGTRPSGSAFASSTTGQPAASGQADPRATAGRGGSVTGVARPVTTGATLARGPRRARLTVKRIDPWSVLRFSFLASLVLLIVFLVAVMVLYGVLTGMHVFSTINDQLHSLTGTETSGGLRINFSFGRVLGISLIIGVVNVVLFTALATLGAFVYNLVADLVGGIEVVLSERE